MGALVTLRRLTLGDKVLLTLASLLVLEAGIRGVMDWNRAAETQHEQFMSTGRSHVRNVAYSARDAFGRGDVPDLARIAELLRTPEDEDLSYVAFYGPDGRLLTASTWPKESVAVPAQIQPTHEPVVQAGNLPHMAGIEHYKFVFPVVLPMTGKTPAEAALRSGSVVAVRSYRKVKARIAEDQLARFLVTATVLAVCLNVLLVFARRLVAPMEELVRGTKRIAEGDFGTPVDVGPRRDELRTLADSFNHMTEQLNKQREQILAHSQELEQKIKERTAELTEANRQIRLAQSELVQAEKMRMLGQLAAGIAHEINTPTGAILNVATDIPNHLRAIVGAALRVQDLPAPTRDWLADLVPHVLAQGLRPSDAATRSRRRQIERDLRPLGLPDVRRVAAVIVRCGLDEGGVDAALLEHLSYEPALALLEQLEAVASAAGISHASAEKIGRIVRALRFYTRSEQDEPVDVDVNETLDNTLTILQSRIKQIARVETHYDPVLPPVRCGVDISQVWTNILNNACDAIEARHPGQLGRIEITTSAHPDGVRIRIANNGSPIPEHAREKIFDPFFTTKAVGKGTGLGLGICTGILQRCGGRVRAWNDPDGASFEVTLPASPEAPAAELVAAGAAAPYADGAQG